MAEEDMADERAQMGKGPGVAYVQGYNVVLAPFLYVMPSELEAYACFSAFVKRLAPRYGLPALDGVHDGLDAG
ncbi:CDC16 protein [Microbotryomycetes sp. JL221]|nr:CDC16 protein [Microbotryomycetes sp. JL221]